MSTAFVLINTENGQEAQVKAELMEIDAVKEVYTIYGVYDLIVKLKTESMSELKDVIFSRIRRLEHVRSTLTLNSLE